MRVAAIFLFVFACSPFACAEGSPEGERLFALKVREILSGRCFACHGGDANNVKG